MCDYAGLTARRRSCSGHYDVQPALLSDGWKYEPFKFTEDKDTGRLYGRGSTDDKGPIMGWLNVIEAHQKTDTELPVNLKFCFEGMEESGSEGLEELVVKEAQGEFADVDAVCISDNYWLVRPPPPRPFRIPSDSQSDWPNDRELPRLA